MATLDLYKGLKVLSDAPGPGGEAINYDFKKLVDWSPRTEWAKTSPPGAGDNASQDFYPGSLWLQTNTSPPSLFVCLSSTTTTATWKQVLIELIQDDTPQLGGDLDVNGKSITTASNGSIVLNPNGSGIVFIGGTKNTLSRGLALNIENNSPGMTFYDNNAAQDYKAWDFFANDDKLFFRLLKDTVTASGWTTWLEVTRSVNGSTTVVAQIKLNGPTRVTGPLYHNQTYCDNAQIIGPTTPGTITFDLALSDMHAGYLRSNTTLALSNIQIGQRFNVTLTQDTTGGRTVTWWTGIQWPGGTVPTLTTTANRSDVFEFLAKPGSTFIGRVWGQNFV